MKKTSKPFGLSFLTEVPAEELAHINGGRRHHKHKHPGTGSGAGSGSGSGSGSTGGGAGGGTMHTMAMSIPQPAFPQGDQF